MDKLGFIGLGVMGEPMCRNLARKQRGKVLAHDLRPEPLKRLSVDGVAATHSIAELASQADVIFLSLPGEPQVRSVGLELSLAARAGQAIVDCSTAPVALARELAAAFTARGAHFADAPVARTRQAAIDGTLAFMVGADAFLFHRIEPLLRAMGSDVTHCGPPGAGQAVKLLNNMVLSATVTALAEALAVAKASGLVEPKLLFDAFAKGSADSFALRNHGMKSLLPESHPERAFPVSYMLKDVSYALQLARDAGLALQSAGTVQKLLAEAVSLGLGEAYHTAIIEAVRKHVTSQH
ncbi:2-hydroxy-3-oxopropionate reductase [Betaproteobacteria bacterium SCGC AG-212-J23]|nr:2-hydroxy-3-oxopropionate reductase [Betaproteobacteria bacterium SCGC AG-212-J23]